MEKLKEFIQNNKKDAIFHYTKLSAAIEGILFKKKLRLSLFGESKDPQESEFMLLSATNFTFDISNNISLNKYTKLAQETNRIICNKIRQKCRLLCFCSNESPDLIVKDDILGHDNVKDKYANVEDWNKSRMWSQYSEDYSGICLVFSKKEIENELKKQLFDETAYKFDYVQYYQKQGFDKYKMAINGPDMEKYGPEAAAKEYIKEKTEGLFFRKHIDHRDEAEYRVVVLSDKLEYLDISSSIKGVIVGNRTNEAYFPSIKQLCENLEIEALQMCWGRSGEGQYLCSLMQEAD